MSSLARLAEGLQLLDELLAEELLAPDPERGDWSGLAGRLQLVRNTLRKPVLEDLKDALDEAGDARATVGRRVAFVLARAAALAFASGDAFECDRLLARAAELAPDLQGELAAARRDPRAFAKIQHARWLHAHGRHAEADRRLRAVERESADAEIKAAARGARKGPRALTSAPPLFRLNGCGVSLYGKRDAAADGSYVATYCVALLFIPVFPLAAYRVRRGEGNSYYFNSREPLGRVARVWQLAVGAAALVALAAFAVQSYIDSPAYKAKVGIAEGRRLEQGGDGVGAMASYQRTANAYAGQTDVSAAAEGVLRLASASVKEPCTPESVPVVGRVVAAFEKLPVAARHGAPAASLTRRLLGWTDQLGVADPRHVRAALAVSELTARVAEGPDAAALRARKPKLERALADALTAADRPLDALVHYTAAADLQGMATAQTILESFGDDPSLWQEAAPEARQWLGASAKDPQRAATAAAFRARLEHAQATEAADATLIEAGDERALAAAFQRQPHDQALARALAARRRARGDARGCVTQLRALGEPGRLIGDAQQLLGACEAELGELKAADEVLSAFLDEHLAPFQRARRDYGSAAEQVEKRLIAEADGASLPADLEKALSGARKEEQRERFETWLAERMAKDAQLVALRAEYLRHRAVVPASLTLGMVKLNQAGAAQGDERKRQLEGAERAFLSIREEAEGAPEYHLGLGQVLYRLGRAADGAKEFAGLLARKNPELTIEVAGAYRELGLESKAREIAEGLYKTASEAGWRQRAARLRALAARDFADEELWLARCDQTSTEVKARLLETRGYRLLQEGKRAEADRSFAQASVIYDRNAAHNAAAANNAALAFMGRYAATGDLLQMKAAVARLESAARLTPDDAILLGNLAAALQETSLLALLERWVRTRELVLDASEVESLFWSLAAGTLREPMLSGLERDPAFLRQLELTRQEQVLAPQKTSPYQRLLQWSRWKMDTPALQELTRRVEAAVALERQTKEERQQWLSGAKDAQWQADARKAAQQAEARLTRLQKLAHAPTRAAVHLLHGDALSALAFYEPSAEAYQRAVDGYRRARELWPEVGAELRLSSALLQVAAWRASAASPALRTALAEGRRVYSIEMLLYRAATGPTGAEILSALRRQPEVAEAATIRRAGALRRPSLDDWTVARLAGDGALEQAAARAFDRADLALSLALDVRLRPDSEGEQAELALFRAGPRAAPLPVAVAR